MLLILVLVETEIFVIEVFKNGKSGNRRKLKKNITATHFYKVLICGGRSKYIRPNLPDIILVVVFG